MSFPQDLFLIGFLAFLEGILSIDNALVLALMAKHLPPEQQRKALTYGLIGAIVFRLISLTIITHLMAMNWVKYAGGGYLIFIALHHLLKRNHQHADATSTGSKRSFWKTVALIELMDIAFAIDSILAAVALTKKFWIVFIGGFMGVVLMRFAATMFLKLLNRFPGLETTAYLLILIIGAKLIIEALKIPGVSFHSTHDVAFWIFWGTMVVTILSGFVLKRKPQPPAAADGH